MTENEAEIIEFMKSVNENFTSLANSLETLSKRVSDLARRVDELEELGR